MVWRPRLVNTNTAIYDGGYFLPAPPAPGTIIEISRSYNNMDVWALGLVISVDVENTQFAWKAVNGPYHDMDTLYITDMDHLVTTNNLNLDMTPYTSIGIYATPGTKSPNGASAVLQGNVAIKDVHGKNMLVLHEGTLHVHPDLKIKIGTTDADLGFIKTEAESELKKVQEDKTTEHLEVI